MKKITLLDCLNKLDEKEINNRYIRIPSELKLKKKKITKEEKIACIEENIVATTAITCFTLTDEEIKQINNIIEGKKVKDISSKLINSDFVFKIEDNYVIPEELKDMFLITQSEKTLKEKFLFVISFYMEVNGILEVNKLLELTKATGFNITKKELLEYIKEKDFIIKKDLIYLNDLAIHLDETIDMHNLKKEKEYKVFTIEEMISLQMELATENYMEQISKILSKKLKNSKKIIDCSNAICNMASIGYNYQDDINSLLEIEKIKLTDKDKIKLDMIVDDIFWYYPTWELNGYSDCELSVGYEEDENIAFEDLSPKEQTEAYINMYLSINGVIELDKLYNIIVTNHNININKNIFIKIVSELNEFVIEGEYLCVEGAEELIDEMMPLKNMLKEYKIIEDIDLLLEEQLEITDRIVEIGFKYNLDEDFTTAIEQIMRMGGIHEEMLVAILEESGYKLASKKQKELLSELLKVQKDVRVWGLNGFKTRELTDLNKSKKIGRNEPCPCNSGKKYKQCCGK